MHPKRQGTAFQSLLVIICIVSILPGDTLASVPPPQQAATSTSDSQTQSAKIPPEQLDSLVAPIALYPDPLLSQTLMASTYPLEIVQLQQWLGQHKDLKDKALADAVAKQPWDPSVQTMAATPDLVKRLADDIKWTTDLGNAFLAQQSDVMDAVQRMRAKAKEKGNLKTSEQQKVETKTIENKQVIVVQPSNPEVVYVPSYNPTVVYGPPAYPYPPVSYPPPPPPGYYAAGMAISFGVGMMMGAFWSGGSCCGCGWGGNNNVTINNNNNFVRNTNIQGGNRVNARGGNTNWQHNPQHRGGAPYADRNAANRYGGTARGDTLQARQNDARQNQARQQGSLDNRGGAGNRGASAGTSDRGNSPSAGTMDRGGGNRGASAGTADRSANRGASDRVGNQSVSGSSSGGAFGGGSGASARASSSRGASSVSGRGGGARGGGRRR
jgi:hypothetical protein